FFFFQAEDGIRDSSVTGVQTCALPISSWQKTFKYFPFFAGFLPPRFCIILERFLPRRKKPWLACTFTYRKGVLPVFSSNNPLRRSEERRVGKECKSQLDMTN